MTLPFSKLKLPLLYVGVGVLSFILFLFLTFPYDAIRQRITLEAQSQGYFVRMRSLGPGFFGVTARGVELSKLSTGPDAKPAEPLKLDAVSLRPSLFPVGVSVQADALGGSISGAVGGLSDLALRLSLSGVKLNRGNLKNFSGVDLEGTADGHLSLDLPATAPSPNGKGKVPNLAEASGGLTLELDKVTIKGGTVTVPMYGQMTPMDLPRIVLGNLEAELKFDKGAGTVEKFAGTGGDVDLLVTGTIRLGRQVEYSDTNLQVKVKPTPEFSKNGFVGMGISTLPPDPNSPGFRSARMTGFLGSPNFLPGT